MIIGNNFVYLHVPKTAGSSFEEMMQQRHGLPVQAGQHSTARDIPALDRGKTIFGFMRDPIEAEVSNWRYHRYSWENNGTFTFTRWCEWRYTQDERFGCFLGLNEKDITYGYTFNVRPQAGYFCDENGVCIATRIFRFNQLQESLAEISRTTGLDCSIEGFSGMSYSWGRGKEDYQKYVTPKAREILQKAKPLDFALWYSNGDISTDFECPTDKVYAYTRV